MEADQQQLPLVPLERGEARLEQVARDVVVERALLGAHRVLEEPRLAVHERPSQELLRLAPQRALEHDLQASAQLVPPGPGDMRVVASQNTSRKVGRSPSSVPIGSTYCTRPQSSARLFWIGVAVSSSTGVRSRWSSVADAPAVRAVRRVSS